MSFDLSSLNAEQLKPVLDTNGAVLVTAGAGSGKTRLLTHRIAYLIEEKGIRPYNILAITFTNKAASEMRERLEKMIPNANGLWVSTFHSMCATFLRKFIDNIGFTSNFSIYGEYEKEKTVKRLIKENSIDDDLHKVITAAISDAKNDGLSPQDFLNENPYMDNSDAIFKVFTLYENELKSNNALDFDDLLNKAYLLLKNCPEAGNYYADKFQYIHVDEFQDTNIIQYKIVKELSRIHKNVMIVGDEDQSIYGWRGANISNIYNFTQDFDAKIYKLEQNYRSTKTIIDAANKLIVNNTSRIKKVLWTDNSHGSAIEFIPAATDSAEAEYVASRILNLVQNENCLFSECAVLLRINALTRSFEEKFMQYGIPCKVFGGFKFYERKEIKDILAYLRITVNPYDNEAITRVINFPKRGIGEAAVQQLISFCLKNNCTLFDAVMATLSENSGHSAAIVKKVSPFAAVLGCLVNAKDTIKHSELIKYLVKLLNLKEAYKADTEENENRKQNIKELISAVAQYEDLNPEARLEDYLQNISLYSETDEIQDEGNSVVSIATIHSAKGLEFKNVFVVGLEKGIFPVMRAESSADIEEERRLMYVAVTRAKERLYLSCAASRFLYNERKYTEPSIFLEEMGFAAPARQKSMYDNYNESRWQYTRKSGYESDYSGYNYTDSGRASGYSSAAAPVSAPKAPPVAQKNVNVNLEKFKTGVNVVHKKFGAGRIVSVSGDDENAYILVEFESCGRLTLSLAYAPLEVVE